MDGVVALSNRFVRYGSSFTKGIQRAILSGFDSARPQNIDALQNAGVMALLRHGGAIPGFMNFW